MLFLQLQREGVAEVTGEEVYSHGGHAIWVRHKYMEALLAVLVPKIEHELQTRSEALQGQFWLWQNMSSLPSENQTWLDLSLVNSSRLFGDSFSLRNSDCLVGECTVVRFLSRRPQGAKWNLIGSEGWTLPICVRKRRLWEWLCVCCEKLVWTTGDQRAHLRTTLTLNISAYLCITDLFGKSDWGWVKPWSLDYMTLGNLYSNPPSAKEVVAPNTGHLRSKYPVESVTMLSVTALSVGRLAATEAGVAALSTLGVTASTLQLAGVVGMAIGGIALLGLGTKYALEAHPFWTRTSAHAEMAEDIRKANHWNVVCQMAFTRGKTQLLSQAARLRYKFSELLLTNSTSTDVLHSLFPDFSLLEQVKAKLSSCCLDIEQFMEAEQTAESALRDLSTCSRKMFEKAWMSIVDVTTRYVEDNSRTDVVTWNKIGTIHTVLTCFDIF